MHEDMKVIKVQPHIDDIITYFSVITIDTNCFVAKLMQFRVKLKIPHKTLGKNFCSTVYYARKSAFFCGPP